MALNSIIEQIRISNMRFDRKNMPITHKFISTTYIGLIEDHNELLYVLIKN